MPSFSVQDLTNFFLRCEVASSNLEQAHDRSSRLMGLVDRGLNALASAPSKVVKPHQLNNNKNNNSREQVVEKSSSEESTEQQKRDSSEVENSTLSPIRSFSQQNVFTSAAKRILAATPVEKNNKRRERTMSEDTNNEFKQENKIIKVKKLSAIVLGLDPTLAESSFEIHSYNHQQENTANDDEDSSLLLLDEFIPTSVEHQIPNNNKNNTTDVSSSLIINSHKMMVIATTNIQRRIYELRLAAIRHGLNLLIELSSIAAVQAMTLPLVIPPLSSECFFEPTQIVMMAFRPAVLLFSSFSTIALESSRILSERNADTDDGERNVVEQEEEVQGRNNETDDSNEETTTTANSKNTQKQLQKEMATKMTSTLLPEVDAVLVSTCDILSEALSPSGFLGPALLRAWWKHFVRKLEPSLLLKELDLIEKKVWSFPTTKPAENNNNNSRFHGDAHHNSNAAGLVLKLYPELPLLSAISLLMLPESNLSSSSSSSSIPASKDPSMQKINEEIQKQLLSRCVGLCNQGLGYGKDLRENSVGWIASRGSRSCVLALLIRSEVQRRMLRHSSALDDTKQAVAIDEGAKVFSGESISPENSKVVNSIVMEFAPALFPSFGNDFCHAKLFSSVETGGSDFIPPNCFTMAHDALCEREKELMKNSFTAEGNQDDDSQKIPPARDVTTLLLCFHRAFSRVKVNRIHNSTMTEEDTVKSSSTTVQRSLFNKSVFGGSSDDTTADSNQKSLMMNKCAFPWSSSSAISTIHRSLSDLFPVPKYLEDHQYNQDEDHSYLIASSHNNNHLSSNNISTNNNLSPMSFLLRKKRQQKQEQHEADEDEANHKFLPPADFVSVCPGIQERVSWMSQPVNRNAPSPFACLGKRFWGVPCREELAVVPKMTMTRKQSSTSSASSSLPPLAKRANSTMLPSSSTSASSPSLMKKTKSASVLMKNHSRPSSAASRSNNNNTNSTTTTMSRRNSYSYHQQTNSRATPTPLHQTMPKRSSTPTAPTAVVKTNNKEPRPLNFAAFVRQRSNPSSETDDDPTIVSDEGVKGQLPPPPPTQTLSRRSSSSNISSSSLKKPTPTPQPPQPSSISASLAKNNKKNNNPLSSSSVSRPSPIPKKEDLVQSFFAKAAAGKR